jgi:pimeloyl-ACP methyl ester carboxylesterase
MGIYHYLPVPLQGEKSTQAAWATEPSGHAIIFVHGFGGETITTWNDFISQLPQRPKCAGCDLIFYGYDGKHTRSANSAIKLRDFLQKLFETPLGAINWSLPVEDARPEPFEYKRITLIAHSLGAIICRDALLQAYKMSYDWAPLTELVLFAPAHRGADIIGLLRQAYPIAWPVVMMLPLVQIFNRFVVLQDLEPGCLTLTTLRKETLEFLSNNTAPTLVARKVILAEYDNIVSPAKFISQDPKSTQFNGKDHIRVCKPDKTWERPVTVVLRVI